MLCLVADACAAPPKCSSPGGDGSPVRSHVLFPAQGPVASRRGVTCDATDSQRFQFNAVVAGTYTIECISLYGVRASTSCHCFVSCCRAGCSRQRPTEWRERGGGACAQAATGQRGAEVSITSNGAATRPPPLIIMPSPSGLVVVVTWEEYGVPVVGSGGTVTGSSLDLHAVCACAPPPACFILRSRVTNHGADESSRRAMRDAWPPAACTRARAWLLG